INHDVPIVIRRTRIVAPNVGLSNLTIWIIRAGRQVCVVPKDLADLENSRRRATVSLFFAKAWLVLSCESGSPCKPVFAEQHGKRPGHNLPPAATRTLKQSQLAPHRIPCRRNSQDELRAIVRNALGGSASRN